MSEQREDLPTIIAAITVSLPRMALGTGIAYLRMKRKARKSAKVFERGLVKNGLSYEIAHELALNYEVDLSIRKMINSFGGNFMKRGRSEKTPPQPGQ